MEELPKRKPVRLKGYDYSQNGAYFVTICTKNRKEILGQIIKGNAGNDAGVFPKIELSEYGEIVHKYISRIKGIEKYVIMPNHVHLIIVIQSEKDGTMWASSPTQSIPQLIQSFKIMVTKEIGFSVFQRSFHDHVIRNERDYQKIWEYIETNPLRWKEDCFYPEQAEREQSL